jgi:hypothetical protein
MEKYYCLNKEELQEEKIIFNLMITLDMLLLLTISTI